MRRIILSLILATTLASGAAFAQSGYWAAVSGSLAGPSLHFGVENVFQGFDLRANLGSDYSFKNFNIGATALYNLATDVPDVNGDLYLGAGFTAYVGSGFDFSVDLLGGMKFSLSDLGLGNLGLFAEAGGALSWPLASSGLIVRGGLLYGF
jgi:hypothetical protein